MKNKHGIEIRVGQVWETEPPYTRFEVVFIRGGLIGCLCLDELNGDPAWSTTLTQNAHRLISCPVLGDMAEWDIVTDEQKRDYKKPKEAQLFDAEWRNSDPVFTTWASCIYRVHRGFDWEPYRKDKPTTEQKALQGRYSTDNTTGKSVFEKPTESAAPIEPIKRMDNLSSDFARQDVLERAKINEMIDTMNEIIEWIKEQG